MFAANAIALTLSAPNGFVWNKPYNCDAFGFL
jgi:hypothetical protein